MRSKFLSLLCCLALFACNKTDDVRPVVGSTSVNGSVQALELGMSLDVPEDSEQPRFTHYYSSGRLSLQLENKDLRVVLAFRRNNNGLISDPVVVPNEVVFRRGSGKTFLLPKTEFTVPPGPGKLEVAGIIVGELGGRDFVQKLPDNVFAVTQSTHLSELSSVYISPNIPYLSTWQTVTALTKTYMRFKPSGSWIGIRLWNRTNVDVYFNGLEYRGNGAVTSWQYDFNNLVGGNLYQGYNPSGTYGITNYSVNGYLSPQERTGILYAITLMPSASVTSSNTLEFKTNSVTERGRRIFGRANLSRTPLVGFGIVEVQFAESGIQNAADSGTNTPLQP